MKELIKYVLIFYFLLALLVANTGCVTQQKCQEKFPPQSSNRDSVHVHDSTAIHYVDVLIPKDSIVWHDSIPCKEFTLDLTEKKNNITASLHIAKGKISFKCLEDSLRKRVEELEHFKTTHTDSDNTKVVTVKEFINHWYDVPCRWGFGILLIVGLLLIILHLIKKNLVN